MTGDQNNCWDYCFGKEEQLATSLVTIINNQKFDGIDIDYEYCYDIADKQSGRCTQRSAEYSDVKAQTFLNDLTSKLRTKLDALQLINGDNRGRYEVTHAPMESDLSPSTSKYFQILKARHQDLDFLMPQFYNGVTRAQTDGISGSGVGSISAGTLFSSLANELFNMKPHKVVFGFVFLIAVARVQTQMLPKLLPSCLTSKYITTVSIRAMGAPSSGLQRMILKGHGVILSLQK